MHNLLQKYYDKLEFHFTNGTIDKEAYFLIEYELQKNDKLFTICLN